MKSNDFFTLIDKLLVFFAACVYICISPSLVHVTVIQTDSGSDLCSTIMIPTEMIVCFVYTAVVYLLVGSQDMLIKSAGYGVAVAPLLAFAEINSV